MNTLEQLYQLAAQYKVTHIAQPVLGNKKFALWSGSSKPTQHHYGRGGLIVHTFEVVNLCLENNKLLNAGIREDLLFLAALYHDVGKLYDYEPLDDDYKEWKATDHKYKIHHITRSVLYFESAIMFFSDIGPKVSDEIVHAILAHHGLREYGSPVTPRTKMAWMLHLCDGISARMDDCDTYGKIY